MATQDDDFGDMGSFAMDMDTFMMSDLERGRHLENGTESLIAGENDFFDERLNDHSTFVNNS